jgi:DNA-binding response OmpR family regulator
MKRELNGRTRALAQFFQARRGRFISRGELLTKVFEQPADSKSRTVETHIQRLLNAVNDSEEILVIRSRHRNGYMLAKRVGGAL